MINKLSAWIILICVILSSCSSKFSLSKRRYTKGYYFAHAKKPSPVKESAAITVTEKQIKPVSVHEAETVPLVVTVPFSKTEERDLQQNKPLSREQSFKNQVQTGKKAGSVHKTLAQPGSRAPAQEKTSSAKTGVPYDFYWSNSGFGSAFLYIGGVIVSIVVFILWFLFIELLMEGLLPLWVFGLLGLAVLAAIVVIAILVAMNSD